MQIGEMTSPLSGMRFSALDGWRGIAALGVTLFHSPFQSHFEESQLVQSSYLLVDFFFVLSGFVISHAYLGRLQRPGGLGSFVIRRVGRLWPLHVFMLGAFVLLELVKLVLVDGGRFEHRTPPFSGGTSLESLFASLLLAQSLGLFSSVTWNAPSWSISVEFYTYFLFAAAAWAIRGYLVPAAIVLIVGSLWIIFKFAHGFMGVGLDYGLFRCIAGFFMGYLTYRAYCAYHARWTRPAGTALRLEVAAFAVALLFLLYAGRGVPTLAAPFIFALVVFVFALERGPISRLLQSQPFRALGEWSYSIYMVHAFLVVLIMRSAQVTETLTRTPLLVDSSAAGAEAPRTLVHWGSLYLTDAMTVIYMLLAVVVASLTYRFVEHPGRDWFNRLARRHEGRRARILDELTPGEADATPQGVGAMDAGQAS
jgi:peptidoglycan/LPS O-acetylase OafA/YrhL